jgi:hypothetical protein
MEHKNLPGSLKLQRIIERGNPWPGQIDKVNKYLSSTTAMARINPGSPLQVSIGLP